MLTMQPDLWGRCDLSAVARHAAATTSCWPARPGSTNTATRKSQKNGTLWRPFRRTTSIRPARDLPHVFVATSSTNDDRVHPGHARKMVAKMEDKAHKMCSTIENIEGGRGSGSTNRQRAEIAAMESSYFWMMLQ